MSSINMKRTVYLSLVQSFVSYRIVFRGQTYESYSQSFKNTVMSVLQFLSCVPRLTNNTFVYTTVNLPSIKNFYHINVLLSF